MIGIGVEIEIEIEIETEARAIDLHSTNAFEVGLNGTEHFARALQQSNVPAWADASAW